MVLSKIPTWCFSMTACSLRISFSFSKKINSIRNQSSNLHLFLKRTDWPSHPMHQQFAKVTGLLALMVELMWKWDIHRIQGGDPMYFNHIDKSLLHWQALQWSKNITGQTSGGKSFRPDSLLMNLILFTLFRFSASNILALAASCFFFLLACAWTKKCTKVMKQMWLMHSFKNISVCTPQKSFDWMNV